MKRIVATLVLALAAASMAAPARAESTANLAPADRYFGHMKMSILGVRNALRDLSARADVHPEEGEHVFDKAVLVEDAMRDWARHFPRDPWLPRYAYALAQLYGKIDGNDARVRRNDTLDWLVATWPSSEFAQQPRG